MYRIISLTVVGVMAFASLAFSQTFQTACVSQCLTTGTSLENCDRRCSLNVITPELSEAPSALEVCVARCENRGHTEEKCLNICKKPRFQRAR